MSHIVSIQTEIRDLEALRAACGRLQVSPPQLETVRLFSGTATGHTVRLPGWRYPVVCDFSAGKIVYDNYGGQWGAQEHLDSLLQLYAVEKGKLEGRRQGHSVTEQPLADGSIKLTIHVGGGA